MTNKKDSLKIPKLSDWFLLVFMTSKLTSKQCPTSFSSMISAPRISLTPHILPQPSTEQSQTSSSNEDGRDTSVLAADSTTHKSTGRTSMPIKSQWSTWKDALEPSESSSDLPTSDDNKATFLYPMRTRHASDLRRQLKRAKRVERVRRRKRG